MNTINAVLEPDADGTLHLPLPPELRRRSVKIVATLEAVEDSNAGQAGQAEGTVLDALIELRKLGGLGDLIPDPVAWQREERKGRALPGRQ